MKSRKARAGGIVAGVIALSSVTIPANAIVAPPIGDPSGVDFDPACVVRFHSAQVGAADDVPSPGTNDNCLVGTYDGSTESIDFRSVNLSGTNGQLVAEFDVDGAIPPAGSTCNPQIGGAACADLPSTTFTGFSYKAMFQNPALQNNTPYKAADHLTGFPIERINEHSLDGFHHFVGFSAHWDGTRWIHSAQIGTYDPRPDGSFLFDELGVNSGSGWFDDDPSCFTRTNGDWDVVHGPGNKVTVKVKGIVKSANAQAEGGCVEGWYAKPGNSIVNIKAVSTADAVATLPVTIPLSLVPGFSDVTSIGGYVFITDITRGNSHLSDLMAFLAIQLGDESGTHCRNESTVGFRECVSYTPGFAGLAMGDESLEVDQEGSLQTSNSPSNSWPDTAGRGPRCWTYTFNGQLPPNPLWVAGQPCHIDDDSVPGPSGNADPGERGTFFGEFWNTDYSFTFAS